MAMSSVVDNEDQNKHRAVVIVVLYSKTSKTNVITYEVKDFPQNTWKTI